MENGRNMMKLSDFTPVNGYTKLEIPLYEDMYNDYAHYFVTSLEEFRDSRADTKITKFRDLVSNTENGIVYKYNDIIPMSGTSGYILVVDGEIVEKFILWKS
jgi:hypothetical protein